jgi:integrase
MEKADDYAAKDDALRALAWITAFFGADKLLIHIDDGEIARMVATRRSEFIPNRKEKQLVSKATVNRTTTLPLRRVMNRAHLVWKMQIPIINWKEHLLPELQERVREASIAEEAALLAELGRGYDIAVRFAMLTGARRMEILNLEWTDVVWMAGAFGQVTLKGKGSRQRIVPLTSETRELLWAEMAHHPVKVFTYIAGLTRDMKDGTRLVRGKRYPLTKFCLRKAFGAARRKAGLVDYRFHDNRHTAATRLLRDSGNLRLVQKLLGHSDPRTTVKYAHSTVDDLAEALEAMARRDQTVTKIPSKNPSSGPSGRAND